MTGFEKMGLKKEILEVLARSHYKKPFEIQKKIVPLLSQKKNVVFTSMTGSGKTLAYSLPFLGKLKPKFWAQLLIVAPTRELSIQISKELEKLCTPLGLKIGVLYGGRTIIGDAKTFTRRNQIMVGTPGRLIQHINEKNLKVGEVRFLVFDESDQMFDNGFYGDCSYIMKRVSSDAQIVLASATLTEKVKNFMNTQIKDFELIEFGVKIPVGIVQQKILCDIPDKNDLLLKYLATQKYDRAMVFCNRKTRSREIADFLREHKLKAKSISGDLEQDERIAHLAMFKKGAIKILVSTDVASRGLHIPDVDIVINYDVPTREEFYIHRIGRTGRNEKSGKSLTFICPEDVERYALLETNFELDVEMINI